MWVDVCSCVFFFVVCSMSAPQITRRLAQQQQQIVLDEANAGGGGGGLGLSLGSSPPSGQSQPRVKHTGTGDMVFRHNYESTTPGAALLSGGTFSNHARNSSLKDIIKEANNNLNAGNVENKRGIPDNTKLWDKSATANITDAAKGSPPGGNGTSDAAAASPGPTPGFDASLLIGGSPGTVESRS
jgi:hypothetical protein